MRRVNYLASLIVLMSMAAGTFMGITSTAYAEEFSDGDNMIVLFEEEEHPDILDLSGITSIDDLSDLVEQDTEESVGKLLEEYEVILSTLSDFDAYLNNPTLTEEFYSEIVTEMDALSIRLHEYTLRYAEIIMGDDTDFDDKYEDLEDIYDDIYDDAADMIYDDIYDDLLDDIYDDIYSGIIDDAYDAVAYDTWSDARSAEYDMWDDARSEVYSTYDTLRSDIYSFYDKLRSHVYKENTEKINKDIEKFQKKIDKLSGLDIEPAITIDLETLDLSTITTVDEMDSIVEADVETLVYNLSTEFETIKADLDTYEKYVEDSSGTEDFYDHVVDEVELICVRLREYALHYAEIITTSDMDYKDQYDELYDIVDSIYSDAGTTLNHEIYGGILKDALKYFYKKVLKSGYDIAPYSEVSSFRSDEYSNISDARSDVYSEISNTRSDIYSFASDLRSAVYNKDMDKVDKVISKFSKKIK